MKSYLMYEFETEKDRDYFMEQRLEKISDREEAILEELQALKAERYQIIQAMAGGMKDVR